MKMIGTLLVSLFLGLSFSDAQTQESRMIQPLKTGFSLLYGTDVVIRDEPPEDQRKACIAVAHNGWLFAAFEIQGPSDHDLAVYKSVDDGETWSYFAGLQFMPGVTLRAIDIIACGTSPAQIQVFLATVHYYDLTNMFYLNVWTYDGATGANVGNPVEESSSTMIYDVDLATDYRFPSLGASPYSVGVLFSKTIPVRDSLLFLASGNGGISFGTRLVVTTTVNYLNKVSLAYGRGFSFFNGRYFAAWEEKEASGARLGHIYTSHTDPQFTDPFTPPFNLDDPAGFSYNKCKNPTMACQFNDADNDMGNITAVVLFERDYNGKAADMDVIGMYNKEAVTTDNWVRLDIANTTNYDIQPAINFDPEYNNFLVTWCDSTQQKLPYVVQYQDLPSPSSWVVISSQYNDAGGLVAPWPKVEINPQYTQVAHVWVRDRVNANGMVMFDAEYSTVGVKDRTGRPSTLVNVVPNPAGEEARFVFNQLREERVLIQIKSLYGQSVQTVTDRIFGQGIQEVAADLTSLPPGIYVYRYSSGAIQEEGKIIVMW